MVPFEDEINALLHLANDSEFGVASSVWTYDVGRALSVVNRLRPASLGSTTIFLLHQKRPTVALKAAALGKTCRMSRF